MSNDLEMLQSFIANNYDLERLEANLNEFNPLKVLKVDRYEIRHSNILAWLLSPKENHNLNAVFTRKLLAEIISSNDNIQTALTVFDIQEYSFRDIEVRREWKNIDLLLISRTHLLAVIIENKLGSHESKGQLKKYYDAVSTEYEGFQIIPVLLSLFGDKPSDERYGIITYEQILEMLKFIVDIQGENLSPKVLDFVWYYIKVLEMLTMVDEEIKELCKKIYRRHREALDLIYEYSEDSEFETASQEYFASLDVAQTWIGGRSAWFLPKTLANNLKKVGYGRWFYRYPIAVWYTAQDNKMGIIVEVGEFVDSSLRVSFMRHLRDYGTFNIRDGALRASSKFSRIYSKYVTFVDWDNKESIVQKMESLNGKKFQEKLKELVNACKEFDWGD